MPQIKYVEVGLIKARNKLSLAYAFAVALAKHYKAELITIRPP
jgi:hypothetical protein